VITNFILQLFSDERVIKEKLQQGAVVVDVRSPHEFDQGKIPGSFNIPLDQVPKNTGYLKRLNKPIILCGAGSDSATAKRVLQHAGLKDVYNGGRWHRVLRIVRSL
jgi:phage shock protein E